MRGFLLLVLLLKLLLLLLLLLLSFPFFLFRFEESVGSFGTFFFSLFIYPPNKGKGLWGVNKLLLLLII